MMRSGSVDRAGRALPAPAGPYSEALVAFARAGRVEEARESIAAMGIRIEPLTAAIAARAATIGQGRARCGCLTRSSSRRRASWVANR